MTIELNQHLGRAKNAVLSFLEGRLSIPKIYMDAEWDGHSVDLLAINRDGAGDVHVVLLMVADQQSGIPLLDHLIRTCNYLLDRLERVPAQYKYVAIVIIDELQSADTILGSVWDRLLSPDGVGKVGFLRVGCKPNDQPSVGVFVRPERFRAKIAKLAEDYIQHHEADWEIRA